MSAKNFKPLTLEDFDLTEAELAEIVEGAQQFLPPVEDDPVDTNHD